ncbi:MAG: hypothetical protein GWM98_19820 [Nitrospinaceae bacterium]|nr:hypothetical protein [Nitrospinaceae bacterium]NIR56322.1 hypothetical protein [Nitrospinaceae bacterium]NIS86779.1 hypothetical protein [Nitrospinaceae bacterium]NIT83614.1 hypothetical protein [Nitrospinaceae bacterium]NIU45816.1 hypothetical protein [Nitrospinaceae bacterium]
MSSTAVKKLALSIALLSFAILFFGSWFHGATAVTAFLRGVEAALVFGLVFWCLGTLLGNENEEHVSRDQPRQEQKGAHLDKTV